MRNYLLMAAAIGALVAVGVAACTPTQQATVNQALASQPGQLFCAISVGSAPIVMGVVQAGAATAGPAAEAEAVLATGASAQFVQNACQQAAANVGASAGVPVSPPANPTAAPTVAVDPTKVTK